MSSKFFTKNLSRVTQKNTQNPSMLQNSLHRGLVKFRGTLRSTRKIRSNDPSADLTCCDLIASRIPYQFILIQHRCFVMTAYFDKIPFGVMPVVFCPRRTIQNIALRQGSPLAGMREDDANLVCLVGEMMNLLVPGCSQL